MVKKPSWPSGIQNRQQAIYFARGHSLLTPVLEFFNVEITGLFESEKEKEKKEKLIK